MNPISSVGVTSPSSEEGLSIVSPNNYRRSHSGKYSCGPGFVENRTGKAQRRGFTQTVWLEW